MLRTACALLVFLGACGKTSCETTIDAIFFVTVAPEQEINLSDCHISFWTISAPPDPCQHGCSTVGGARIGLNTFESCRLFQSIFFLAGCTQRVFCSFQQHYTKSNIPYDA